jgi:hypothetical protein
MGCPYCGPIVVTEYNEVKYLYYYFCRAKCHGRLPNRMFPSVPNELHELKLIVSQLDNAVGSYRILRSVECTTDPYSEIHNSVPQPQITIIIIIIIIIP